MNAVEQLTRMALPAERSLARLEQPRARLELLAVSEQELLPCERDALAWIGQLAARLSANAALAGAIAQAEQKPEAPQGAQLTAAHAWPQGRAPQHDKPRPAELASWLARAAQAGVRRDRMVDATPDSDAHERTSKPVAGHAAPRQSAAALPRRAQIPASVAAASSSKVARLVGPREQARAHLGQLAVRAGATGAQSAPIAPLPAATARVCATAFQALAPGSLPGAASPAAMSGAVERALTLRPGPAAAASAGALPFAEPVSQQPAVTQPAAAPDSTHSASPKQPTFTWSAAEGTTNTVPLSAAHDTPLRRLARLGAATPPNENESPNDPESQPSWPATSQEPDDEALAQRLARVLRWHAKRQGLSLGSEEEHLP